MYFYKIIKNTHILWFLLPVFSLFLLFFCSLWSRFFFYCYFLYFQLLADVNVNVFFRFFASFHTTTLFFSVLFYLNFKPQCWSYKNKKMQKIFSLNSSVSCLQEGKRECKTFNKLLKK